MPADKEGELPVGSVQVKHSTDPGRKLHLSDLTGEFDNLETLVMLGQADAYVLMTNMSKHRLGQKNLLAFTNGKAVVDVGDLTIVEKKQILYNHVNFGKQTQSWKKSVKPFLNAVAAVDDFLPGIAERLGDPAFTKGLGTSESELIRFMKEPREHLINTINVLDNDTKQLVEKARDAIREATREIERKQEERDEEGRSDWDYMSSVSRTTTIKPAALPTKQS